MIHLDVTNIYNLVNECHNNYNEYYWLTLDEGNIQYTYHNKIKFIFIIMS